MARRWLIWLLVPAISAVLVLAGFLAAPRKGPHHPPTFKELRKAMKEMMDVGKPDAMEGFMAVFSALQFTPEELEKIRASGDVRLLIGAGIQSARNPSVEMELLHLAVAKAPGDPAALAALACRQLQFTNEDGPVESDVLDTLKRWRQLEPENSVPYYLEAALSAKKDKFEDAVKSLAEAGRHPGFNSHAAALHQFTIAAGEFVGYPKYAARIHAFTFAGDFQLGMAGRSCAKWKGGNEQVARDCLLLGQRLEADSRLFMGQLVGIAIQKLALKKLPQAESDAALKAIEERAKRIREANERLEAAEAVLTERLPVSYLDDVFATSETEAAEKLPPAHGSSPK